MRSNRVKKIAVLVSSSVLGSMLVAGSARADDSGYLQQIAQNTKGTLDKVDKIPDYIGKMFDYIGSWLQKDDSDQTIQLQGSFAQLGQNFTTTIPDSQNSIQLRLAADILGQKTLSPDIVKTIPGVNNLIYSSLMGYPPVDVQASPLDPYKYVKTATGGDLVHTLPPVKGDARWAGEQDYIDRYAGYYNTIIAAESYSNFILSNLYAENLAANPPANANPKTKSSAQIQNDLVTQASSSDWIANVTSEELGKVLRQILIFQSQTYVLLTQLVQTEKQLLTAQAMTNSLIIATSQLDEAELVKKAISKRAT